MRAERDAWGNKRTNNLFHTRYESGKSGFCDFKNFYPRPEEQTEARLTEYAPSPATQEEINKRKKQKTQKSKKTIEELVQDIDLNKLFADLAADFNQDYYKLKIPRKANNNLPIPLPKPRQLNPIKPATIFDNKDLSEFDYALPIYSPIDDYLPIPDNIDNT